MNPPPLTPAQRDRLEKYAWERLQAPAAAALTAALARLDALEDLVQRMPRVVDEEDGDVGIDFDFANDQCVSLTITSKWIGWSAVVNGESGSGSGEVRTPEWLRKWLLETYALTAPEETR